MKRMNLSVGILCFALMLLLCSCGLFGPQRYVCEADKVESIQIIRLDEYVVGEYRYEYTVLCEIEDRTVFIERLNRLKHRVNWGDPMQLHSGYIVIRVGYLNGDFDYVNPHAQWFNRSGRNNYGFFFFDEEQFNALISDYWTE